LSVNFFGGHGKYTGTRFINCSDRRSLRGLVVALAAMKHPKYQSTAIYSAIGYAAIETQERAETLPGGYIQNVIVMTDGQDTASPADIHRAIDKTFPCLSMNLFVIGVGRGADTAAFQHTADQVLHIADFDGLARALLLISQALGG